jgi:hypothetical protein
MLSDRQKLALVLVAAITGGTLGGALALWAEPLIRAVLHA